MGSADCFGAEPGIAIAGFRGVSEGECDKNFRRVSILAADKCRTVQERGGTNVLLYASLK